jgi:integrase
VQLYKRGRFYHFDFWLNGDRHRGSTKLEKKADAARYVEQYRTRLLLGKAARDTLTIGQVSDIWFERKCAQLKSAKTTAFRLKTLFRHLDRNLPVDEIGTPEVEEAIQARRMDVTHNGRPPTNATVNRDMIDSTLRPMLGYAKDVLEQPVNRIRWDRLRQKEADARTTTFTDDQIAAWRQALPDHHRPLFDFMARYGVRLREAFFAPDCIKADDLVIVLKNAKTGDRLLTVLPDDMRDIDARAKRAIAAGLSVVWFRDVRGVLTPIHPRGFQSASRTALDEAGISGARPAHDLRHHAATRLLRGTGNTFLVQRALGHADVQSTARYAHVSDDDVRAGLARTYPRIKRKTKR